MSDILANGARIGLPVIIPVTYYGGLATFLVPKKKNLEK